MPNGDESPKESQVTDVVLHQLNHLTDVPLLLRGGLDGGLGLLRRIPNAERDQRVVAALDEPISDEARLVPVGDGEVGLRATDKLIGRSGFHLVESDTCLLHQSLLSR